MRSPLEIMKEYRSVQSDMRARTDELFVTVGALRKAEIHAIIDALRETGLILMAEYRDACAARAEELKNLR
ncbi:MAG TPA: hypothetical protein VLJ84_09585 [Usitatibacter sp.]|nr:hypothetical protein [Usitatibacter sp.]